MKFIGDFKRTNIRDSFDDISNKIEKQKNRRRTYAVRKRLELFQSHLFDFSHMVDIIYYNMPIDYKNNIDDFGNKKAKAYAWAH